MTQRLPSIVPRRLFSAASTTEAAITDSTSRDGRLMMPMAARLSVMECASVNAVTTLSTSLKLPPSVGAGSHWLLRRSSTAGSSNDSKNKMWS